ncbi:hypothetical protein RCL_jg7948.t1 [Rhizophagus clarus]|uniref:Uncharacterized protein n=1 Tax=Rhizophagus clarus TaxID=94130 RepID=A0A8H3MBX0_9GLOM|nr:hypothetical protein RCL_jg7948.t1 [Rhizophagus clarus]
MACIPVMCWSIRIGRIDETSNSQSKLLAIYRQNDISDQNKPISNEIITQDVQAKSHLTISNKWAGINSMLWFKSSKSYMPVIRQMDTDLR